jgi:predicted ATP-grasp superfamily ATP-dependent carboligase
MSGIRGVFGIDFVLNHRGVHVLEVNPRQTASMELIERRHGLSIFDTHVQACRGSLPEFDLARVRGSGRVIGKAVAFARVDLELGDTRTWLRSGIADVPRPGTTTPAGAPVCTVFASGADHEGCVRALRRLTGTLGIGGPSVTGPRREAR